MKQKIKMPSKTKPLGLKQYQDLVRRFWHEYIQDTRDTSGAIANDVFMTTDFATLVNESKGKVMTNRLGQLLLTPRAIAFQDTSNYFIPCVLLSCPRDRIRRELAERVLGYSNYTQQPLELAHEIQIRKYFLLTETGYPLAGLNKSGQKKLEEFLRFATTAERYFSTDYFYFRSCSLEFVSDCIALDSYNRIKPELKPRRK